MPEITISGRKPSIGASSASTAFDLRSSDFEKLPLDRNYRNIATLVPQANVSYLDDETNVSGATGRENKYFVDGVDVTDPSFSKAGTNLPYNFIKEIDVTTGGYEAEYRGSLGGLVNVITYSGGNEFHGSAFGFFTNNGLTASRRGALLDPTQGRFSNYDFGFGIGGPIVQDELWFYAAYNPTFNRRDAEIPGLGTYVDKTVEHSFAGKLTWRASQKLNFTLTTTGDPSVRKAVGDVRSVPVTPSRLENIDPYLADEGEGGVNLSLRGRYFLADRILVEASLSRVARNQTWEPSTKRGRSDTVLIDMETGTWSGGSFGHLSFFRSGITARSSATVIVGNHTVKGGLEYRNNVQDVDLDYPLALYRYSDTLYQFGANGTHGSVENRIYTLFVQDNWQIFHSLAFHAGLRWDAQWVYGGNGKVVHRIRGLLQPRVGFVFQPGDDENQKIFVSIGRYAQEWSTALMTIYTGDSYWSQITYDGDPRAGGSPVRTMSIPGTIPGETALEAQQYDEVSLGYERAISTNAKVRIQGVYRTLRQSIDGGALEGAVGNPGQGLLSGYPKPRRQYSALILALQQHVGEHLELLASYVLSRNYGNYEGLYDSFNRNIVPNVNFTYFSWGNSTGLLPNDRTHVFKVSASYSFSFGLVAGTTFTWQTGTPLSDFAGGGGDNCLFLQPRGSAGRTPDIWDLNARLTYPFSLAHGFQSRLILDVFHVASQRKPVDFMQEHYGDVNADGTVEGLIPSYGVATRYQPPMSVRLGIEVRF